MISIVTGLGEFLLVACQQRLQLAFVTLATPAAMCILGMMLAKLIYPNPETMEAATSVSAQGLPAIFWIYRVSAGHIWAGFADYPLLAHYLQNPVKVASALVPMFYAVARGIIGVGSLFLETLYKGVGFAVLILLTAIANRFASLLVHGNVPSALTRAALWRLGIGVHESRIPAAFASVRPVEQRASTYGVSTGEYGLFRFPGSRLSLESRTTAETKLRTPYKISNNRSALVRDGAERLLNSYESKTEPL